MNLKKILFAKGVFHPGGNKMSVLGEQVHYIYPFETVKKKWFVNNFSKLAVFEI